MKRKEDQDELPVKIIYCLYCMYPLCKCLDMCQWESSMCRKAAKEFLVATCTFQSATGKKKNPNAVELQCATCKSSSICFPAESKSKGFTIEFVKVTLFSSLPLRPPISFFRQKSFLNFLIARSALSHQWEQWSSPKGGSLMRKSWNSEAQGLSHQCYCKKNKLCKSSFTFKIITEFDSWKP